MLSCPAAWVFSNGKWVNLISADLTSLMWEQKSLRKWPGEQMDRLHSSYHHLTVKNLSSQWNQTHMIRGHELIHQRYSMLEPYAHFEVAVARSGLEPVIVQSLVWWQLQLLLPTLTFTECEEDAHGPAYRLWSLHALYRTARHFYCHQAPSAWALYASTDPSWETGQSWYAHPLNGAYSCTGSTKRHRCSSYSISGSSSCSRSIAYYLAARAGYWVRRRALCYLRIRSFVLTY